MRIDGIVTGNVDQTARDGVAENKGAIATNVGAIALNTTKTVKPGGTIAQVYVKASADDYDGTWVDPSSTGGTVDAVARAGVATNAGAIATNVGAIATNVGAIATNTGGVATNTGAIATVNTNIGAIPAPLTTVGDWITNLRQGIQLDADEEGTLNSKINGVNNRLVDEVTAREGLDTTLTAATVANAQHITTEIADRTAGDIALGLRIDAVPSGGGGGAGVAETIYTHPAPLVQGTTVGQVKLVTFSFTAEVNDVVELVLSGDFDPGLTAAVSLTMYLGLGDTSFDDWDNAEGEFLGLDSDSRIAIQVRGPSPAQREGVLVAYLSHTAGLRNVSLWVNSRSNTGLNVTVTNLTVQAIRSGGAAPDAPNYRPGVVPFPIHRLRPGRSGGRKGTLFPRGSRLIPGLCQYLFRWGRFTYPSSPLTRPWLPR